MSVISDFGEGLKQLREDSGLSQVALGKAAAVTQSHLSAYETGKRLPNLETLGRILDALGADFLDLHNSLAEARGDLTTPRTVTPRPAALSAVPPAPERVLVDLMREEVRRLAAEAAAVLEREGLEGPAADPPEAEAPAPAAVTAGVEPDV